MNPERHFIVKVNLQSKRRCDSNLGFYQSANVDTKEFQGKD